MKRETMRWLRSAEAGRMSVREEEVAEDILAELKRLRHIKRALRDVRRRVEIMGDGEASDSVRVHNRLLNQSEDALKVIHAALKKGGRK